MIHCPACDTLFEKTRSLCPGCGFRMKPRNPKRNHCPVCKEDLPASTDQCGNCGYVFPVRIHDSKTAKTAEKIHASQYAIQVYYPRARDEFTRNGSNIPGNTARNNTSGGNSRERTTPHSDRATPGQQNTDRRAGDALLGRLQTGIGFTNLYLIIQLAATLAVVIFGQYSDIAGGYAFFFSVCVTATVINLLLYSAFPKSKEHISIWFIPFALMLLIPLSSYNLLMPTSIATGLMAFFFITNRSATFPLFYIYTGRLLLAECLSIGMLSIVGFL